jgi:hypothetical protein
MNLQRIEVDASELTEAELDHLADLLEVGARVSGDWPHPSRLLLLDLADQLRNVRGWRIHQQWMIQRDLAGELPDPNEPPRRSWPPGWRRPDDEAVGL